MAVAGCPLGAGAASARGILFGMGGADTAGGATIAPSISRRKISERLQPVTLAIVSNFCACSTEIRNPTKIGSIWHSPFLVGWRKHNTLLTHPSIAKRENSLNIGHIPD